MERIGRVKVFESLGDTARRFGSTGVSSSVAEGDIKKARVDHYANQIQPSLQIEKEMAEAVKKWQWTAEI